MLLSIRLYTERVAFLPCSASIQGHSKPSLSPQPLPPSFPPCPAVNSLNAATVDSLLGLIHSLHIHSARFEWMYSVSLGKTFGAALAASIQTGPSFLLCLAETALPPATRSHTACQSGEQQSALIHYSSSHSRLSISGLFSQLSDSLWKGESTFPWCWNH